MSFRYAAMALNFKQPATYKPEVTQWEAVTGEAFNGPQVPLGALVYYRSKEPRAAHSPNALPGIFAGWRIESGFRYRKTLLILGYEKVRVGSKGYSTLMNVPEAEMHVPEQLTFPLFESKQSALKQMALTAELPQVQRLELPFDETSEIAPERQQRRTYIRMERVTRLGATPGCKSCKH